MHLSNSVLRAWIAARSTGYTRPLVPPSPPTPPSPSPLNSLWPGVSPVARVFFYLGRLVSSGKRKIDLWTLTQHSPSSLLPYLFLNKSKEKIFSPMIQQISYTMHHRMLPLFVERTVSWYFWPPFLVKKSSTWAPYEQIETVLRNCSFSRRNCQKRVSTRTNNFAK